MPRIFQVNSGFTEVRFVTCGRIRREGWLSKRGRAQGWAWNPHTTSSSCRVRTKDFAAVLRPSGLVNWEAGHGRYMWPVSPLPNAPEMGISECPLQRAVWNFQVTYYLVRMNFLNWFFLVLCRDFKQVGISDWLTFCVCNYCLLGISLDRISWDEENFRKLKNSAPFRLHWNGRPMITVQYMAH